MPDKLLHYAVVLALVALCTCSIATVTAAQESEPLTHLTALGDTWAALAWRYATTPDALLRDNQTINRQRQPAIAAAITVPNAPDRSARLLRPAAGGLLELSAHYGRNPWSIAIENGRFNPYAPLLSGAIFLPGGASPPRDLPSGYDGLAISAAPYQPGHAFALRGRLEPELETTMALDDRSLVLSRSATGITALGATGAFAAPGQPLLTIQSPSRPLWEQPLLLTPGDWTWEQVTFNEPAVLDLETIRNERERLQALWDRVTPHAYWQGQFQAPIADYVELTSLYGARRSVNGGPYNTYHEGTDFSAFQGTEVTAPAAGLVILAETLSIRGGTVLLDHGLGLHSGYYHLSAIEVFPGQIVEAGQILGKVGSTGRSTGNHLHWDLLVGRTWVDPLAWLAQDTAAWLAPQTTESDLQSAR